MFSSFASALMKTRLGLWPVRVRAGFAKGARWTLGPFSANWRYGGAEDDVRAGAAYLGDMRGRVFWDFGAHFGIHTVGMAMQVGRTGQVASFEPDPVAFARLKRHVTMNRLANVRLFQAAASSRDATGEFYLLDGGGSSNSHFEFHTGHVPSGVEPIEVPTIRVDTLVAGGEIRPPDLIKVDVQGHGHHAIAGGMDTIKQAAPVIAFSNHSWEEIGQTRKLLEPLGYIAHDLSGAPIDWDDVSEAILVPPRLA
jgi:FkbM family methyltransferase